MSVEWRAVDGFIGYYEVSNTGVVRSVDRNITKSNGVVQKRSGSVKKQMKDKDGYMVVKLSIGGIDSRVPVHVLVAKAFVDGYFDGAEVNHKDFNRSNNNASNLEWVTRQFNVHYSIDAGRHVCTTDLTGCNNPNYGNHTLRDRYRTDRTLSKEKQGRPGSMNGRARSVELQTGDERIVFGTIKDCAEYMIDNFNICIKVESLSVQISKAMRNGALCHGHIVRCL